jgi:hypothetical protein
MTGWKLVKLPVAIREHRRTRVALLDQLAHEGQVVSGLFKPPPRRFTMPATPSGLGRPGPGQAAAPDARPREGGSRCPMPSCASSASRARVGLPGTRYAMTTAVRLVAPPRVRDRSGCPMRPERNDDWLVTR